MKLVIDNFFGFKISQRHSLGTQVQLDNYISYDRIKKIVEDFGGDYRFTKKALWLLGKNILLQMYSLLSGNLLLRQDFDFSLLTSHNRKLTFQRMIKRYIKSLHDNKKLSVIMDPFFILVALLLGEESEIYSELMGIINNQSEPAVFSKEDLQFYIPELCTYLVFHQQLKNKELQNLLLRACKVDIHFSLKYYFYMKSLQVTNVGQSQTRKYNQVIDYNTKFRNMINNYYRPQKCKQLMVNHLHQTSLVMQPAHLSETDDKENIRATFPTLTKSSITLTKKSQSSLNDNQSEQEKPQKIEKTIKQKFKINKIRNLQQTNIYQPFLSKNQSQSKGIFESTINFFSDLIQLSTNLIHSNNRKQQLISSLQEVNSRLPATIYIPFTKQQYQNLNIINIVSSYARVFNTKQRVPYYICLESFYNPTFNEGMSKDRKIRSFTNVKMKNLKKSDMFQQDSVSDYEDIRQSQISIKVQKQKSEADQMRVSNHSSEKQQKLKKGKKNSWSTIFKLTKQIRKKILNQKTQNDDKSSSDDQKQSKQPSQYDSQAGKKEFFPQKQETSQSITYSSVFGETEREQFEKISQCSPYSNLPGYKLIHVIIKSNDDLRQQSFAMQLLQEFDKIFKLEKLPVKLLPYEVLPLSHEAGIMECVRDAITIDQLKKKGKTLKSILNTKAKIKNFIYTLTGYSLVTYFLQVKDRHNGNIMIRSDGSLFHIDYGFFMSNLPGKGVEIQKNLPFKLTNQYVQALDGLKSKHFQSFRKYFYKAFNACRQHQHRILILTKLMYSSYGKTMPCFQKGDEAIIKLQQRFNPSGVTNDAENSFFCQNLINSSIDNWRSRWYDKWQYYFQGILY